MTEPQEPTVALRAYIDALLAERDRALQVAAEERGRTAEAVRDALVQQIAAGDKGLEMHIKDQIASVRASLESAEKLRREGLDRVAVVAAGSQRAIDKAEDSVTKRLDLLGTRVTELEERLQRVEFGPPPAG